MAALALLAVDPLALGGLWLRARAGGARERFAAALPCLPLPPRRLPPAPTDEALFGGLDLAATLALGRRVRTDGLLAQPATLLLAMAERCSPALAGRLAGALDSRATCLVALDEGAEEDEALPPALADRLALFVALDGLELADLDAPPPDPAALAAARARLPATRLPDGAAEAMARAAAALGIASLRAPLLALAAARAAAALAGRAVAAETDLQLAAELVLAHRAAPQAEAPPPDPDPDSLPPDSDAGPADPPPEAEGRSADHLPADMLVEAARAALPPDLLARLAAARAARGARAAAGSGAERTGNRRGRPLPSRPGRPGGGGRIDLVATLRAAAPWQPLRRAAAAAAASGAAAASAAIIARDGAPAARPAAVLLVRGSDLRLRRFRDHSDRVLIFAVDASGSAAAARLAEAKGAVELLLAAAYARRDHVALLAFRGQGAELILPPTRSLVATKRRLQGLPGGGGTPLAHGLALALATAGQARGRGLTPTIALLTDGRGNIALDGRPDRPQAEADALRLARAIRAEGLPAVVIDTASRPQPALRLLSQAMAAPYLPLPRADARRLSGVLDAALAGPG